MLLLVGAEENKISERQSVSERSEMRLIHAPLRAYVDHFISTPFYVRGLQQSHSEELHKVVVLRSSGLKIYWDCNFCEETSSCTSIGSQATTEDLPSIDIQDQDVPLLHPLLCLIHNPGKSRHIAKNTCTDFGVSKTLASLSQVIRELRHHGMRLSNPVPVI